MSKFPRIFAHRGASSLAPENTIAAFAKALEVGARRIEFDVDVMGDGTLLIIHDHTLDRTTSGTGGYYDKSYAELRRLDAGKWFSPVYRFERVPELADVVTFARKNMMLMNLEIKPCFGGQKLRDTLLENLLVAIREVPSEGFLVSSFDHDMLARFHQARPDVELGWLFAREDQPGPTWDAEDGAAALGCRSIHPDVEGLTREEVEAMKAAGFEVNVWTVNDVELARELAAWGVDGIFTDRPQDFPADALAR